jgi:hypothetical protein
MRSWNEGDFGMSKLYTVEHVQSITFSPSHRHGFRFNLVDNRRRPIASFSFATKEEAEDASELISIAIENAQEIIGTLKEAK